jgi:hypothetical protein
MSCRSCAIFVVLLFSPDRYAVAGRVRVVLGVFLQRVRDLGYPNRWPVVGKFDVYVTNHATSPAH